MTIRTYLELCLHQHRDKLADLSIDAMNAYHQWCADDAGCDLETFIDGVITDWTDDLDRTVRELQAIHAALCQLNDLERRAAIGDAAITMANLCKQSLQ